MKRKQNRGNGNLKVGKPDIAPSTPSHVEGVRQGNETGSLRRSAGIHPTENGDGARGTARRSTGINPKAHETIHPKMPKLQPA